MIAQIKSLSIQSLIYGAGHVLARLVTFLLLPLYTNVFSPADYGVVSLAYTFLGFMNVILHYGLDAALMKHYVPADDAGRKTYLTSAYASFLVTSVGVALIFTLVRGAVAEPILGGPYPKYLIYMAWIMALDILWSVPMLLLRSEEKPFWYVGFSLFNVISTLTLNLVFILKMNMGIEGVFLSNLITSGLLCLLTLPMMIRRLDFRSWSSGAWKQLMRFGLPFLPSGIFAMIMELADRYLLKYLTDMETVGLYSAGYKLGMLMLLLVMGFNMGWQPFFLREGAGDDQKALYARVSTYVLAGLGFVWVLLVMWVDDLVRLNLGSFAVYGEAYWSSTVVVPWIALAYIFHATFLLQLPGVFLKEKSQWVAVTRGIGAVSNIGLNLIFIPWYGAVGAALATTLSFALMGIAIYLVNRRIFPVPYEWKRLLWLLVLAGSVAGLFWVLQPVWWVKLILTFVYPAGLFFTGWLRAGERSRIVAFFTRS